MMDIKKKKSIEIDEAMDSPKAINALSNEELMRLFGRVEQDEDGQPFIFPEAVEDSEEMNDDGDVSYPRIFDYE
jgi:hypothetical protein